MGIIPDNHKEKIKNIFTNLEEPVKIITFTQDFECAYCKDNTDLLKELVTLSDKLELEIYDFVKDIDKAKELMIDKIPAIALIGKKDYGIRFYGIPSGYEFGTLIEDIVDVSKGTSRLSQKSKDRLKTVDKPIHIQVFVTLTCPYCPRAVRLAHQFAIENDNIRADMIESTEFPQLANRYQVMAVPKTVVNDTIAFEGALPEEHYLEHILLALEEHKHT
ncbi:MAG: glutaredoxin [Candidatus Nitrosocaldaceae archaeon]|nr:MAG: glutaredoxin [Candidatus Nitrosocaldaceae archaeon]